jgi:hypothetical protein
MCHAFTMTSELEVPTRPSRRGRRRRRWLLAVLLACVVAIGWLAVRGYEAATGLRSAQGELQALQGALTGTGDLPADTDARVSTAQRGTARARAATADPLWRAAGHLPVVGADFAAMTTVSAAVDGFARDVVPNAVDVRRALVRPAGGSFDVDAIARVLPGLVDAGAAADRARVAVDGIDPGTLHGSLGTQVRDLQGTLRTVSSTLDVLAGAARALGPILGAAPGR